MLRFVLRTVLLLTEDGVQRHFAKVRGNDTVSENLQNYKSHKSTRTEIVSEQIDRSQAGTPLFQCSKYFITVQHNFQ